MVGHQVDISGRQADLDMARGTSGVAPAFAGWQFRGHWRYNRKLLQRTSQLLALHKLDPQPSEICVCLGIYVLSRDQPVLITSMPAL